MAISKLAKILLLTGHCLPFLFQKNSVSIYVLRTIIIIILNVVLIRSYAQRFKLGRNIIIPISIQLHVGIAEG